LISDPFITSSFYADICTRVQSRVGRTSGISGQPAD
jgi:hypothetical protein